MDIFREDPTLEEAMSNASYMNVQEMRILYYGRMDLYAAFSDNDKVDLSGREGSDLVRPYGLLCFPIDTIIARKVGTNLHYAHITRFRGRGEGFLANISTYNRDDFFTDLEVMKAIPYLGEELVSRVWHEIGTRSLSISYFQQFWNLTKSLAEEKNKSNADKFWRRILEDLGYDGFNDPSGKGILTKARIPATLLIKYKDRMDIDIMPVQKYRKDRRRMLTDRIDLKVKRLHARRNRIARQKTPENRKNGAFLRALGRSLATGA